MKSVQSSAAAWTETSRKDGAVKGEGENAESRSHRSKRIKVTPKHYIILAFPSTDMQCKIILFLFSVEYWESTGGKCAKPHLITKRSVHVSHAHKSKNNNKQPQNRNYKRWKTNQCQKEKRGRDKEASQISCRKGKANILVQQDDSQKQTIF